MTTKNIHEQMLSCWNLRDFEGMRKLLHPQYRYTGPDGKTIEGGPQVAINIAKMYADSFPDGIVTIGSTFESGDTQICEFVCRGSHGGRFLGIEPTHKIVEIRVCNIVLLKDGMIYHEREYTDMLSILTQIGAAPEQVQTPLEEGAYAHH